MFHGSLEFHRHLEHLGHLENLEHMEHLEQVKQPHQSDQMIISVSIELILKHLLRNNLCMKCGCVRLKSQLLW